MDPNGSLGKSSTRSQDMKKSFCYLITLPCTLPIWFHPVESVEIALRISESLPDIRGAVDLADPAEVPDFH
jgi:hypothetical protein